MHVPILEQCPPLWSFQNGNSSADCHTNWQYQGDSCRVSCDRGHKHLGPEPIQVCENTAAWSPPVNFITCIRKPSYTYFTFIVQLIIIL